MLAFAHFHQRRRSGSVLLPVLFVVIILTVLLGAILPLTVTGYGLSRADRDRAAALAAAEAGLNWEIGRIDNRLWDKDDSGNTAVTASGNPTLDTWPSTTGAAPSTASTAVLTTDASGNWTQRFLVGTSVDPFTVGAAGSFTIIAEGQVRAADGHIVKRRVVCGGSGLASLFDTLAVFAFSNSTSTAAPAWSIGGNSTIVGGCGSNGLIYGNGGPTITTGPLGLWGPNASITGVTTTGIQTMTRPLVFATATADAAASLFYSNGASSTAYTVGSWAPTGYDKKGNSIGPVDSYGRKVNTQAEICVNAPGTASDGALLSSVTAAQFLDANNQPVLDGHLLSGSNQRLRLKPGVYYFAEINLGNSATVEIANDWYKANGQTQLWDVNHQPINGPATSTDYDSMGNRITIFVDAVTVSKGSNPYLGSGIGSGLFTALQGDKSASNPLRYRRPSNFRIYAKNTGDFTVSGNSSSPVEFNTNLLHYNKDASGNSYGSITLTSSCQIHGGLLAWTVSMSGGATVQQYGTGIFAPDDPVTVAPYLNGTGGSGSSGAGSGGGVGGGFGGWQWQEVAAS